MDTNLNTNTNSFNKPIFPPLNRPTNEDSVVQTIAKKFIDTPTHFETDYISMKWIPEKRRIDVIWKQFVSEDKVREVLLKEVAMIRHTKVKCLFLDAQKFKGTNPNIPRWANEVWSQMVHDAGLKHFATVVSDKDIFAVFSLKYGMGEKLTSLVNCAVFKTIEEGEVWLRQYTHPEKPVYSEEELENIREEYELVENKTLKSEEIEDILISENQDFENEIIKTELEKTVVIRNEFIETESLKLTIETELEKFDLKNEVFEMNIENNAIKEEVENEFEQNETEEKNQTQVFSKFEDLENHIQNIEKKNSECADNSESQS